MPGPHAIQVGDRVQYVIRDGGEEYRFGGTILASYGPELFEVKPDYGKILFLHWTYLCPA